MKSKNLIPTILLIISIILLWMTSLYEYITPFFTNPPELYELYLFSIISVLYAIFLKDKPNE